MTMKNSFNKILSISLILLLIFLASCQSEKGQEVVSFLVGFVIFMVGTVVVGIPSIVLSAVSISAKNTTVAILAIVFTVLYLLFFFISVNTFSQTPGGLDGSIAIFPVINLIIIVMNSIFIYRGFKTRNNQDYSKSDSKSNLLDDIINSTEEEDTLI